MKIVGFVGNIGCGKDTAAGYLVERGWVIAALADRIKQLAHRIFLFDEATLFGPSDLRNAIDSRGADPAYWNGVYFRAGQQAEALVQLFQGARLPLAAGAGPVEKFLELLGQLQAEPEKFSARHVLQQMGTEWGRAIWSDVWVNALRITISKISGGYRYSRLNGIKPGDDDPPPGVVITDCRFPNEVEHLRNWGGQAYWLDASKRVKRDLSVAMNKHASEPTSPEDFGGLITGVIDNNKNLDYLKRVVQALAA